MINYLKGKNVNTAYRYLVKCGYHESFVKHINSNVSKCYLDKTGAGVTVAMIMLLVNNKTNKVIDAVQVKY